MIKGTLKLIMNLNEVAEVEEWFCCYLFNFCRHTSISSAFLDNTNITDTHRNESS